MTIPAGENDPTLAEQDPDETVEPADVDDVTNPDALSVEYDGEHDEPGEGPAAG